MCTTGDPVSGDKIEAAGGGSVVVGTALPAMRGDDDFFCSLVDCIPARYYFDQDTAKEIRDKIQQCTEDALLSNGGGRGGGNHKLGQAGKHKFAKFNPQINKSVTQILKEVEQEERGIRFKKNKKLKKDRLDLLNKQGGTLHSSALDKASSIEALQQTLRAKIEKMKNGRDLEQIRARREFQKLRQQKNKTGTGNKIKHGQPEAAVDDIADATTSTNGVTGTAAKPAYNADGKMVFSKFDFSNSGVETDSPAQNRVLKKMTSVKGGLKGYKKHLEFVEDKQKKLEDLKQTDPEKAKVVEEKSAWLDALDRSKGLKKRDNADLLKKTIKRREKMKERSQKKWTARQENVRKQQDERQAKRKANLHQRRETKVGNKLKKLSKKGRVLNVPGF